MLIDKSYERAEMKTIKIVYWQEHDGMWLGHIEAYPDYLTQGETLDELKENLKDILGDLESKEIPLVRTHEDMAI
jgi:predicted RNase H-like HicB family nuclease